MAFHDPKLEKTRMCRDHPECEGSSWTCHLFAHSEEEIRCSFFATQGYCPLPAKRDSAGILRCWKGKHTTISGSIQYLYRTPDEMKRIVELNQLPSRSEGTRPLTACPTYVVPLPFYHLPDDLAACIAQNKCELRDRDLRNRFQKAIRGHLCRALLPQQSDPTAFSACSQTALTASNFRRVLSAILFVEQAHQLNDMRRYDIDNADLQYQSHNNKWQVKVPSLAEKRPSVLRGDRILLFDVGLQRVHTGYVHFVNLDSVDVDFDNAVEYRGPYDVYFQLPLTTWRIQHRALESASIFLDSSLAAVTPQIQEAPAWPAAVSLTETQRSFVHSLFLNPRRLHILWGPPGTGKTTTLVEAIAAIRSAGSNPPRILLVAPSNTAADLLVERLVKRHPWLSSQLLRVHSLTRSVKDVKPEVVAVSPTTIGGSFEFPTLEQVRGKSIIVATLSTSSRVYSVVGSTIKFDFVICDEAGQATETELLLPLCMAHSESRIILAGDPKQLGPVLPPILASLPSAHSPLVRLVADPGCQPCVTMLVDNFRSHQTIVDLFNPTYENRLIARAREDPNHALHVEVLKKFIREEHHHPTLLQGEKPAAAVAEDNDHRAIFLHCNSGKETQEQDSPSWLNMEEARIVTDLVRALPDAARAMSVALTPYAKQVKKLQGKFHAENLSGAKASSVEMFQGQEMPFVFLSCVRSANCNEIDADVSRHLGFLRQPQRLNVAISRPKSMLIIVGNMDTLCLDPTWQRICCMLATRRCVYTCKYSTPPKPESWRVAADLPRPIATSADPSTGEEATPDDIVYSRLE